MSGDLVCNVCRKQFNFQKKLSEHTFTFLMAGASYINGWVFLWKGLGLQKTTLWTSGSFWRRSGLLLITWRAPVTGTIFVSMSAQGGGAGPLGPQLTILREWSFLSLTGGTNWHLRKCCNNTLPRGGMYWKIRPLRQSWGSRGANCQFIPTWGSVLPFFFPERKWIENYTP